MDERYLEELTRARHRHALACLHTLGGSELDLLAGLGRVRAASPGLGSLIRFAGPGTEHDRLGDWLPRPRESQESREAGEAPAGRRLS
jgi:hypothetical protein